MNHPLISIVICTYNRAHLLKESLKSVLKQTYNPVEIILVDDGSKDNTKKLVLSEFKEIKYYYQHNQGIAVARTNGCKKAEGEYIVFHDDDDIMDPKRLKVLYKAIKENPQSVLSVGDWQTIDANGNQIGRRRSAANYSKNNKYTIYQNGYEAVLRAEIDPGPLTTLFKKSDGERIGWFDKRFFHGCEDTDFFARMGMLGQIVYTPTVVSYCRRGHDSLTRNNIKMYYSRFLYFEKHINNLSDLQIDLKNNLRIRMRHTMEMISYIENGLIPSESQRKKTVKKRGLPLLRPIDRVVYMATVTLKHPIRRMFYFFRELIAGNADK